MAPERLRIEGEGETAPSPSLERLYEMLDKRKAAALLAPAFTDPQLGRLLMMAVAKGSIEATAERSRTANDFDRLFEVCEALRLEQRKEEGK